MFITKRDLGGEKKTTTYFSTMTPANVLTECVSFGNISTAFWKLMFLSGIGAANPIVTSTLPEIPQWPWAGQSLKRDEHVRATLDSTVLSGSVTMLVTCTAPSERNSSSSRDDQLLYIGLWPHSTHNFLNLTQEQPTPRLAIDPWRWLNMKISVQQRCWRLQLLGLYGE